MKPAQFKAIRIRLNFTQTELGRMMGMTTKDPARTIRKWENGEMKGGIPETIATLLQRMMDDGI